MKDKVEFCCLTYHRVVDDDDNQYAVSNEQLKHHLALLDADGFVPDGFAELETRLRDQAPWPARYAVLSFDDGHESNMQAAELLERYGCKATFFLTRDPCLRRSGFIRAPEIRDLRRRGFSLGTHGTTHRKLTRMSRLACVEELKESKSWLEDVVGEEIRYMAAPGGYVDSEILKLAYQQGYVLVATCKEWLNSPIEMSLPGTVNRVNVRRHFSLDIVRRALCGSRVFYAWRRARSLALAVPKKLV